jgi:hypothetical protein
MDKPSYVLRGEVASCGLFLMVQQWVSDAN